MDETEFLRLYEAKRPIYEAAQGVLEASLNSVVVVLGIPKLGEPAIRCRVSAKGIKSAKSLFDKASRQQPPLIGEQIFQKIYDISRAAIICNNLNEVYSTVASLKNAARKKHGFRIPKISRRNNKNRTTSKNPVRMVTVPITYFWKSIVQATIGLFVRFR